MCARMKNGRARMRTGNEGDADRIRSGIRVREVVGDRVLERARIDQSVFDIGVHVLGPARDDVLSSPGDQVGELPSSLLFLRGRPHHLTHAWRRSNARARRPSRAQLRPIGADVLGVQVWPLVATRRANHLIKGTQRRACRAPGSSRCPSSGTTRGSSCTETSPLPAASRARADRRRRRPRTGRSPRCTWCRPPT